MRAKLKPIVWSQDSHLSRKSVILCHYDVYIKRIKMCNQSSIRKSCTASHDTKPLSTEAMKENVWEYINPDPNWMVLESTPAKPTEPVAPKIDFSKTSEAQLLLQKYQIKSNTYKRQLSRYEKHQKCMKYICSYILDTVYIGHKPMI
ncbi:hypothetical protein TSTA_126960 [Talaromyces stipitatus ATCC 10500]|uniref:Uncharacterized protein n=1 Tax=Talaromyces stipitatus (strain ATCC 10500 / CBS 375.48 / QM 6759 / NRRL 1006) TaxID=441959 RepID=B8MCT6_TALSN|nr:uncharacterized protein TSTA_126960 [Talaromyces stipitatus ATCC 10500]EED18988.1 hypothetical protein TSTA_126960 [Talaromyces stipitatus ATCC 10500]